MLTDCHMFFNQPFLLLISCLAFCLCCLFPLLTPCRHPSTPPLPFPAMPSRALTPSPALPQERVRFLNVGPTALPGVIVMSVTDGDAGSGMAQLDSR
ncbi:unnamed protein product [Closterium sp. NIES-54]